MLDDLRDSATSSYNEEKYSSDQDHTPNRQESTILGMTAPQRFIIVVMLLFMSVILGCFFLIITEKVVIPFF